MHFALHPLTTASRLRETCKMTCCTSPPSLFPDDSLPNAPRQRIHCFLALRLGRAQASAFVCWDMYLIFGISTSVQCMENENGHAARMRLRCLPGSPPCCRSDDAALYTAFLPSLNQSGTFVIAVPNGPADSGQRHPSGFRVRCACRRDPLYRACCSSWFAWSGNSLSYLSCPSRRSARSGIVCRSHQRCRARTGILPSALPSLPGRPPSTGTVTDHHHHDPPRP